MDIEQNLSKLGLDEKEATLYLALLQYESITILHLSRVTKIPRSTVYHNLNQLVEKGFAEWILQQNTTLVKAKKPTELDFLLKLKKVEFEEYSKSLQNLQSMIPKELAPRNRTNVRYYQGVEGMRQLIWNSLKAKDEVVGFSEFGRIDIVGKKFYDEYVNEFKIRKISDRAITNESGLDYVSKHVISGKEKHQINTSGVRFISKDIYYVSGDHSLYNDIYSISYWNKGEVVGIEIENPELVKLHRSIFNILWDLSVDYDEFKKSKGKSKSTKNRKKR